MKKALSVLLMLLLAVPVLAQTTSTISYGETVTGTISESAPSQVWEFSGNAGDVVTITMIADESSSLDTRLYLYDESNFMNDGVALAENDDSGDDSIGFLNSRIENAELPSDGTYYIEATRFGGEGDYTLMLEADAVSAASAGEEIRQWANFATGTSQYGEESWSFSQATGAPNTAECGDYSTAWASATSTGSDMLALEFATPVRASEVNIHQTYNPGSIIRVEVTNTTSGEIFELPNSADPVGNTPCPGVFTVAVPETDMLVDGVIIYLDQTLGGGWNEIDAVELVGMDPEAVSSVESVDGAQTVALDDGASTVSLTVPEGWVTEFDGTFTLAASAEEALTVFTSDDIVPAPEGETVMAVISPASMADIGSSVSEQTTAAYLETALGAFGFTGEIVPFDGLAVPASFVEIDASPEAPPNATMYMLEVEEGFVWVVVVTGGAPADFEAEVVEIVNSLAGVEPSFAGESGASDDGEMVGSIDFGELVTTTGTYANGAVIEMDAPADLLTQVDDIGYYYLATSQEVLDSLIAGNTEELPMNQIGITVALPDTLTIPLGLTADSTARQALEAFVTAIGSTGPVEDYDSLNDSAVIAEMEGELTPPNTQVIVTENEDGLFFFAIQRGSGMGFEGIEDTIIEMINSMSYTPGS